MKRYVFLTALLLMQLSCMRDKNPLSFSYELVHRVPIGQRANALVIDKDLEHIIISISDPSENDYAQKILKFNLQGEFLGVVADYMLGSHGSYSYYTPLDLAVDKNHHLYVLARPLIQISDGIWSQVEKISILRYDSQGNFLQEYGIDEEPENISFCSIACRDDFLYFTNGSLMAKIGIMTGQTEILPIPAYSENQATVPLWQVTDMAADRNGSIWLTGQASFENQMVGCHITRLDAQLIGSTLYYSMGRTDEYGALLNNPGIALDRNDNIYLATGYCRSVEIYDKAVQIKKEIIIEEPYCFPMDIALDGHRNIYVLDAANNQILVYQSHGE